MGKGVRLVGMADEAALHAPTHNRPQMLRQALKKWRSVDGTQGGDGEEPIEGCAESSGIEIAAPVQDLLGRIVEVEESTHPQWSPTYQRCEGTPEGHNMLGGATDGRVAREAPPGIGNLGRIDIGSYDLVVWREFHRGAASGGNAEDSSPRPEHADLD